MKSQSIIKHTETANARYAATTKQRRRDVQAAIKQHTHRQTDRHRHNLQHRPTCNPDTATDVLAVPHKSSAIPRLEQIKANSTVKTYRQQQPLKTAGRSPLIEYNKYNTIKAFVTCARSAGGPNLRRCYILNRPSRLVAWQHLNTRLYHRNSHWQRKH